MLASWDSLFRQMYTWNSAELNWLFTDFKVLLLRFDFKDQLWILSQDHAFALESSEHSDLGDNLCATTISMYHQVWCVICIPDTYTHSMENGQQETFCRSSQSQRRKIIVTFYYNGIEYLTKRRNALSWEMVLRLWNLGRRTDFEISSGEKFANLQEEKA